MAPVERITYEFGRRGHEVSAVVPADAARAFRRAGVDEARCKVVEDVDIFFLITQTSLSRLFAPEANTNTIFSLGEAARAASYVAESYMRAIHDFIRSQKRDLDLMVINEPAFWMAAPILHHMNVPYLTLNPYIFVEDGFHGYPSFLGSIGGAIPPIFNGVLPRALHNVIDLLIDRAFIMPLVHRVAHKLLPDYRPVSYKHLRAQALQRIVAASPALLKGKSHNPALRIVGYIAPEQSLTPLSAETTRFIEAAKAQDKPVLAVIFGSMPVDLQTYGAKIITAARAAGCAVIIVKGWSNADSSLAAHDVHMIDHFVHYDRLLPHISAVISHCGSGSAHQFARHGVPVIPMPCYSDQFVWAAELHRLGLATKTLELKHVSAEKLGWTITGALDNPRPRIPNLLWGAEPVSYTVRLLENLLNIPETAPQRRARPS